MTLIRQGSTPTPDEQARARRRREEDMQRKAAKQRKRKHAAPVHLHGCAALGCDRIIQLRFRFCREHSGIERRTGDALDRRLPGSYETAR